MQHIAMKIDNKYIIYGQHHYHVIAMLQNTLILVLTLDLN